MLVGAEELKEYMSGIGLTPSQEAAADKILAGTQRSLERYLNRRLEPGTFTETLTPDVDGFIYPSNRPVTGVTSILDPWGNELYQGDFVANTGIWGGGYGSVTITYTGGLTPDADALEDVRLAIMRVASREMTTKHDDTLSVKDLSARDDGEPTNRMPLGWTEDELAEFDRLRKRVMA